MLDRTRLLIPFYVSTIALALLASGCSDDEPVGSSDQNIVDGGATDGDLEGLDTQATDATAELGGDATEDQGGDTTDDRGDDAPTCDDGLVVCDGECVDTDTDESYCGSCAVECLAGEACQNGTCECDGGTACDDGCFDLMSDALHCGSCDRACENGRCIEGICECDTTLVFCPGDGCFDLSDSASNCGSCDLDCSNGTCISGQCSCGDERSLCDDGCYNLLNDPTHCGDCATDCGTEGVCVEGECQCAGSPLVICDDGCFDLSSDLLHCGDCETSCGEAGLCLSGLCTCPGSGSLCPDDACYDLDNDPEHCGDCDVSCGENSVCNEGECACPGAAQVQCDDGCFDLSRDPDHCGDCVDSVCTGDAATCVSGECRCEDGGSACVDGCFDFDTDVTHCGDCDTVCGTNQVCQGGQCLCDVAAGFEDCTPDSENLTCRNLERDANSCGECFNDCGGGAICVPNEGEGPPGLCECPVDETDCNGNPDAFNCRDLTSDFDFCGDCGDASCADTVSADPDFAVCAPDGDGGGACQCADGLTDCPAGDNLVCFDLNSDVLNCGSTCDGRTECGDREFCVEGSCICRPGLSLCDGECVDTASDPNNCGGCGIDSDAFICEGDLNACDRGECDENCGGGLSDCDVGDTEACVDTSSDPLNCGACGNDCAVAEVCLVGDCREFMVAQGCPDCDECDFFSDQEAALTCNFNLEDIYPDGPDVPICVVETVCD